MALDVYREIPSVLISTALGLRPRAVLISTSGIFPVYRLKPCVNLYVYRNICHLPRLAGNCSQVCLQDMDRIWLCAEVYGKVCCASSSSLFHGMVSQDDP